MAVLAVRRPRDAAALRRAGVGAGVRRLVLALGGEQIVAVAALVVDVDAPRFLGIAILRVLMAARLALGGGGVAAVRRMLSVMILKILRFIPKPPKSNAVAAQHLLPRPGFSRPACGGCCPHGFSQWGV